VRVGSVNEWGKILKKEVRPTFSRIKQQSCFRAVVMNGFRTHIKGHNQLVEIQHWRLRYIPPGNWPPNSPDLSPIENVWSIVAAAVYDSPAADNDGTQTWSSEIYEINFFDHCTKSHWFNAYTLSWSTAVVMLLRNFWMLQHYWVFNCCWAAICIIFSSSNFIDHTYQMI